MNIIKIKFTATTAVIRDDKLTLTPELFCEIDDDNGGTLNLAYTMDPDNELGVELITTSDTENLTQIETTFDKTINFRRKAGNNTKGSFKLIVTGTIGGTSETGRLHVNYK